MPRGYSSAPPTWRVEVDAKQLKKVVSALKREEDGKALAKSFIARLRVIGAPAVVAARASILGMESHSEVLPGLRASIAKQTRLSVRTTGKYPGMSVTVSKSGMPRQFRNAGAATNAPSWRHKVFGHDSRWVSQIGKPGWFEKSIEPFKPGTVEAAKAAMDEAADRVTERSRL